MHDKIQATLSKTYRNRNGTASEVIDIGQHYAGLIGINRDYALALHTDGVGTKILVAEACQKYDTIGIDCVAMNVNDVICVGAEPFALTNCLTLERARPELVTEIMRGLARGAQEAGIAVVSGETAIMPEIVSSFDLTGTVAGIVHKKKIITGEKTQEGDTILGLKSSGIHSNGLTLARKLLLTLRTRQTFAGELLRPTRIYVKEISKLLRSKIEIHCLAHITGGAYSKLRRIGERAKVGFHLDNLHEPQRIFRAIQKQGHIPHREMYRTFNMGTGFLVICPERQTEKVKRLLPEIRQVGRVTASRDVRVAIDGNELRIEKW